MRSNDYWVLTIRFWQHAVEAGHKPVEVFSFADGDLPGGYRRHEVEFAKPPSRADFEQVVRQTFWMLGAWGDTLLPLLATNDWPYIEVGHKASSVPLHDAKGQLVGELDVRRGTLFQNAGYYLPTLIEVSSRQRVVSRLPVDKRDAAERLLLARGNWICEQIVTEARDDAPFVDWCMRELLYTAGLLRSRPKKPAWGAELAANN